MNVRNRFTGNTIGKFSIKVRANLRGANLYRADLYGADLREADLYGANLRGANLREANLREANLREANLRGADLYGADLRVANLREANLREANLYEAKGIVHTQFPGFALYIQIEYTKIGCEGRSNTDWLAMSDEEAIALGAKKEHLEFYRQQIKLGVKLLRQEMTKE